MLPLLSRLFVLNQILGLFMIAWNLIYLEEGLKSPCTRLTLVEGSQLPATGQEQENILRIKIKGVGQLVE